MLAHVAQHLDNFFVHQPEVAGINRDIDIGDSVDDAVKQLGREELEPAFALARGTDGVDNLKASLPALDHFEDQFGRVLQVGVNQDDGVTGRVVHARRNRGLMAEVASKVNHLDARILLGQRVHHLHRAVTTAIVDQHQLPRLASRVHDFGDARVEDIEVALFIVDGRDDGILRAVSHFASIVMPGEWPSGRAGRANRR